MKRLWGPGGSLRRSLLSGSLSLILVLVIGVGVLMWTESRLRREFYAATEAFLQEQRIAEEISRAVSRQVIAASLFAVHGTPELMGEVQTSGDRAYNLIRKYLFRDLTPGQRLKLEAMKEAHQHLEAGVSRMLLPFENPSGAESRGAGMPAPVIEYGRSLQSALDEFLELREADVEELRRRQAKVFRSLHLAGAGLALVLLGIAIPFTGFLHKRLAGPLADLATTAERIEGGDFTARVELAHGDELATVGESFNKMVDTLVDARGRLEAKNRELEEALERLRETQAELVQTEKLGAVGQMMAGLAHELNNPLASVLGYGHLLQEELSSASEASLPELEESCLRPLVEEAERARELTRSLLRFSRRSEGALVPVELRRAMGIVERLRVYSFEQAGLKLEVAELPEVCVLAEAQGLQQVFLNLVNNAFDAMEGRGHGTLHVEARVVKQEVRVSFRDDGPGFPDPDRAFDPFFTTKPAGKGTGLGLSLVQRFVSQFGGTVRASNGPSGGAWVRLSLPLATERTEAQGAEASAAALEGETPKGGLGDRDAGGVLVLVVEDEAPLRALQKRLLERLNARVLTVTGGEEARKVLEERRVDLVVSDVKMPGPMDGIALFRWVRAERPGLERRFLFVTGDTEDAHLAEISAERPGQLIQKPFRVEDYVERVLGLLTGS